jgi:glucose-6-phosphate dehydrogenase assembly protein OpcA
LICCDIIHLKAKAEILEHLYGLTLSLLIPDLALELWWPEDIPLRSTFFRQITEEADRVWVDSAQFRDPEAKLAELAVRWSVLFPMTVLADLNWVRFRRWRNLVAELFDGEWTSYLSQINRVVIEYGEGSQMTRSFLLACWMAASLGWKYKGELLTKYPSEIEFDSAGGAVTVVITPVQVANQKRDRLFAIRIFTGGSRSGVFTVQRDTDPQCVVVRSEIDGVESFRRILCFEHLEFSHLLGEGLKHWGRDQSWGNTLAILRTIIKAPAAG